MTASNRVLQPCPRVVVLASILGVLASTPPGVRGEPRSIPPASVLELVNPADSTDIRYLVRFDLVPSLRAEELISVNLLLQVSGSEGGGVAVIVGSVEHSAVGISSWATAAVEIDGWASGVPGRGKAEIGEYIRYEDFDDSEAPQVQVGVMSLVSSQRGDTGGNVLSFWYRYIGRDSGPVRGSAGFATPPVVRLELALVDKASNINTELDR